MNGIKVQILFFAICITFLACAGGSRSSRIDFDKLPTRNEKNSVYMKCPSTYEFVCKYRCSKYKRDNTCEEGNNKVTAKIPIKKLLDSGAVVMDQTLYIQYLSK